MVDSETNAKIRKDETSAPKIKDCRKFNVIGLNKRESCSTVRYFAIPDIVHTLFHNENIHLFFINNPSLTLASEIVEVFLKNRPKKLFSNC